MSVTRYAILRCDRCGREETDRVGAAPEGWGKIAAAEKHDGDRPRGIGSHAEGDDLCAPCVASLFAWWGSAAGPQDPPPPPPSPRALTAQERAAVAERAVAVMSEQIVETIGWMRRQPTSIITGELEPEATAGLRNRAELLVNMIASQLSRKRKS